MTRENSHQRGHLHGAQYLQRTAHVDCVQVTVAGAKQVARGQTNLKTAPPQDGPGSARLKTVSSSPLD